jgi:deazaflavin-dependent oxidoreductase (nitroreductase family)
VRRPCGTSSATSGDGCRAVRYSHRTPPAKGTQGDRHRLAFPARASRARSMTAEPKRRARLPPRWFVRAAWVAHRTIYSVTGGRFGLRRSTADRWGMMRLRTVGRRTGEQRTVILGYFEDGPNLVTMVMNGWAEPEPDWWLNLRAEPDARSKAQRRSSTIGPATCNTRSAAKRASIAASSPLRQ